jgi:hypothetical protein
MTASIFSAEVRLLRRPFAVYRELASEEDPGPLRTAVERTILLFVVIAASVSFITAGRLTLRLLVGTTVAWGMVPLLEWAVVLLTHAIGRPKISRARAIGLYMAGNAPLLLFMLASAAMCIFSPDVYATFTFALRTLILPLLLLGSLFYGWTLSYAYYRAGLGFGRGKALALLVVDVVAKISLVVGWYMAINNILPQVLGTEPR